MPEDQYDPGYDLREKPKEPKTKHEEIMSYIESTNDIVSKLLERSDEAKERRKNATFIIDKFVEYLKEREKQE